MADAVLPARRGRGDRAPGPRGAPARRRHGRARRDRPRGRQVGRRRPVGHRPDHPVRRDHHVRLPPDERGDRGARPDPGETGRRRRLGRAPAFLARPARPARPHALDGGRQGRGRTPAGPARHGRGRAARGGHRGHRAAGTDRGARGGHRLPGREPRLRTRQRPGGPGHGRRRLRGEGVGARADAGDRHAAELGRPGGGHERRAALRRPALRHHAAPRPRPGAGRDQRRRGRRCRRRGGRQRPARAARAPGRRGRAADRRPPAAGIRPHGRDPARGRGRRRPGGRPVTRVLIAEDQTMMRDALTVLLDLEDDFEVVAQVASAGEVVPAALRARPDVALLDIEMPGGSGLDATADLRAALPECVVVIVTTFGRPGYLRRALDAGARGFVVKDRPVGELAQAIRRVLAGEVVVDPALATAALSAGPNPLTPREREVLAAAADGSTAADISQRLYLSESTVRNHLSACITKTGTRNRMEAVRVARHNGWL
ncbi:response regulator [Microbispora sp. NEAU-D428]|nr:response regulator [Microbispora sitophila]